MQEQSTHDPHTPTSDGAPTLGDAMRVTHKALRASLERLKGNVELEAHLGMMEADQRLRALEPEIRRLTQRAGREARELGDQIRIELSQIARKIEEMGGDRRDPQ